MNFLDQLDAASDRNQSILVLGLDPNPEMLPAYHGAAHGQLTDELWDWLNQIIVATADLVCAYKPSLGFYQSLGASGLELLEQVLLSIPADIPVILDAKHSDLNSSSLFAHTIFEQWHVDAVTLNPFAGQDQAAPFLVYPDKAAFITCRTSNPGAIAIQNYPMPDAPLYLHLVKEVAAWGPPNQVCLEIGTSEPNILAKVRHLAPERLILARSIWQDPAALAAMITAGLNSHGSGLLLPVPQDFLAQENPMEAIASLNTEINQHRQIPQQQADSQQCNLWTSNLCLLEEHPHQDLILQLFDLDCILFGDYIQASGATFSYYVDLRKVISNPQVFHQMISAYGEILKTLQFNRIAGLPYGALPTATGLSLHLGQPMIFPRKEVKAHGTRRVIEGHFQPGETAVVIDDTLISGKSALEGVEKLTSVGLKVTDIVVFINHEAGGADRMRAAGYHVHEVLTLAEITETLYEAGRIDEEQYTALLHHDKLKA